MVKIKKKAIILLLFSLIVFLLLNVFQSKSMISQHAEFSDEEKEMSSKLISFLSSFESDISLSLDGKQLNLLLKMITGGSGENSQVRLLPVNDGMMMLSSVKFNLLIDRYINTSCWLSEIQNKLRLTSCYIGEIPIPTKVVEYFFKWWLEGLDRQSSYGFLTQALNKYSYKEKKIILNRLSADYIQFFLNKLGFAPPHPLTENNQKVTRPDDRQKNNRLVTIDELTYQGAFKVVNNVWGESGSDYANGAIAYNKKNNSLFFVGKDIAISEIPLIDFIDQGESESVIDLNIAEPIQNFYKLGRRIPKGNPTILNIVTGLTLYNDKLFVNLATFYDAAIQSIYTTMLINNPDDLANMEVSSLYEVEGRVHAAGWFTDVPSEWQPIIGSSHIAGHAANFSIDARHSMGPSAFGINLDDFENNPNTETPDFISTSKLLDYPLANPLSDDGYNESGTNELWVQLSQAYIGFIVPNTYTYMVIGHSGGHESGLGYKITQTNGALCPGACPYDHLDYHNYYWLYDMNDLVEVKKGLKEAFDVKPYDYGVFNTPYRMNKAGEINPIRGATFDPVTGSLYLLLRNAGQVGNYDRPPLILKYHIQR